MAHHEHNGEEVKSYNYLYYLVGLLTGGFIGLVVDDGFIWIPALALVGLLFGGFFLNVFVKGRGETL